mmetsp:Transcript_145451/g.205953  ORF Transcript_145451/g.205953 Transcript_145451/m.205953 type:complete len:141 (+) Transcript_145451:32-454(+)
MADLKEGFTLFDKKGDSKIAAKDIGTVLRSLGLNPTQSKVETIITELGGGESRISFEEFMPIYNDAKSSNPTGTQADFVEGLKVFDKDGGGQISASELRHVLTSLGEKLTDDEVDALLENLNITSTGSVNCSEFVASVMS